MIKKFRLLKKSGPSPVWALKEAKALVEGVPTPVKEGIAKEDAEKIKEQLEAAGAQVDIK